MKITDKKQPIQTAPDGVWESSIPKEHKPAENGRLSLTTDLQGNGYPQGKKEVRANEDRADKNRVKRG